MLQHGITTGQEQTLLEFQTRWLKLRDARAQSQEGKAN